MSAPIATPKAKKAAREIGQVIMPTFETIKEAPLSKQGDFTMIARGGEMDSKWVKCQKEGDKFLSWSCGTLTYKMGWKWTQTKMLLMAGNIDSAKEMLSTMGMVVEWTYADLFAEVAND